MRKILFFLILTFIIPLSYPKEKPQVIIFYSPTCKACLRLRNEVLPKIIDKYKEKVDFLALDTTLEDNGALLVALSNQFKKGQPLVPSILAGNKFLVGFNEINNNLEEAILKELKEKSNIILSFKKNLFEVFRNFSLFTIISAGLVDGINPCAFAVIVFFVSFLTVRGYRKKDIIIIGSFYCFAVFLTYILIGIGLFNFLYSLEGFYFVIKIFYYLVAFLCFLLAGFSLYDAIKFKKTKETDKIILQLPQSFKKKINLEIGSRLREKRYDLIGLAITSLAIGFSVSILEALCTGQVYIPTIVYILKNLKAYRIKALSYLLVYNLMFIFPLILIFILALIGVSSQKLNNFLRKNLFFIKIILTLIFILLGILLISDEIKEALNFYIKILK